ncbi:uncharacterized protein [Parasteatoda tepidariorum]|uniref:uncharacterized protein isoform X2 n=1 Tax=Parasteatoda tepidariorum TaxID=114398 RepID=UPI001C71D5AA|nr:uncharacterized protein LOC107450231 isoform X2 [Parasteatoda tepidariorum]
MSLHKTFTCTFVLFAMLLLSNIGGEHLPYRDIPLGFLDISQYQDLYKNAFNNMNPLLKGPLIPVAEMVFDTVECILRDLSQIGCNINTTVDLFELLRNCSDGKGLLSELSNIDKLVPEIGSPLIIPPTTNDALCGAASCVSRTIPADKVAILRHANSAQRPLKSSSGISQVCLESDTHKLL